MKDVLAELDRIYEECVASVKEIGVEPQIEKGALERAFIHYISTQMHIRTLYGHGFALNPDITPMDPDYEADNGYRRMTDFVTDNLNILRSIPTKLREKPYEVPESEHVLTSDYYQTKVKS